MGLLRVAALLSFGSPAFSTKHVSGQDDTAQAPALFAIPVVSGRYQALSLAVPAPGA
jgi:hypothetical protein